MDSTEQSQISTDESIIAGKLLDEQARVVCEKLSGGEIPYSQWAQALLAIDEGASQAEAAQRTGLTIHQVRYWLAKFRKTGLNIFPLQTLELATTETPVSMPDVAVVEEHVATDLQTSEEGMEVKVGEGKLKEASSKLKIKKSKDKKKGKKSKERSQKKSSKKGKAKKRKQQKKSKKGKR